MSIAGGFKRSTIAIICIYLSTDCYCFLISTINQKLLHNERERRLLGARKRRTGVASGPIRRENAFKV